MGDASANPPVTTDNLLGNESAFDFSINHIHSWVTRVGILKKNVHWEVQSQDQQARLFLSTREQDFCSLHCCHSESSIWRVRTPHDSEFWSWSSLDFGMLPVRPHGLALQAVLIGNNLWPSIPLSVENLFDNLREWSILSKPSWHLRSINKSDLLILPWLDTWAWIHAILRTPNEFLPPRLSSHEQQANWYFKHQKTPLPSLPRKFVPHNPTGASNTQYLTPSKSLLIKQTNRYLKGTQANRTPQAEQNPLRGHTPHTLRTQHDNTAKRHLLRSCGSTTGSWRSHWTALCLMHSH